MQNVTLVNWAKSFTGLYSLGGRKAEKMLLKRVKRGESINSLSQKLHKEAN